MGQDLPLRTLAVYLHIPFCLSRCGYCSFFSVPFNKSALADYLRYLHGEIDLFLANDPSLAQAKTLYFGGGTPSLLDAEQINSLCSRFLTVPDAENTLEINPLQITASYLKELSRTPVNRLSIGLQSLDDTDLAYLDRRHRSAQIAEKISLCRDFGFDNISLDLIYGLPGSSATSVEENVKKFIALQPEHISSYLLTLDTDAPLVKKAGSLAALGLPDDDTLAEEYDALRHTLVQAGFEHYEISNFCQPGRASRHNIAYWKSEPWLGQGASASGWLPPMRYTNPADLDAYCQMLDSGQIMANAQNSPSEQQRADYIMMGLRLLKGLDLQDYSSRFGLDLLEEKHSQVAKLLALGMLELEQNHLRLSSQALFISNAVIGELL